MEHNSKSNRANISICIYRSESIQNAIDQRNHRAHAGTRIQQSFFTCLRSILQEPNYILAFWRNPNFSPWDVSKRWESVATTHPGNNIFTSSMLQRKQNACLVEVL